MQQLHADRPLTGHHVQVVIGGDKSHAVLFGKTAGFSVGFDDVGAKVGQIPAQSFDIPCFFRYHVFGNIDRTGLFQCIENIGDTGAVIARG